MIFRNLTAVCVVAILPLSTFAAHAGRLEICESFLKVLWSADERPLNLTVEDLSHNRRRVISSYLYRLSELTTVPFLEGRRLSRATTEPNFASPGPPQSPAMALARMGSMSAAGFLQRYYSYELNQNLVTNLTEAKQMLNVIVHWGTPSDLGRLVRLANSPARFEGPQPVDPIRPLIRMASRDLSAYVRVYSQSVRKRYEDQVVRLPSHADVVWDQYATLFKEAAIIMALRFAVYENRAEPPLGWAWPPPKKIVGVKIALVRQMEADPELKAAINELFFGK